MHVTALGSNDDNNNNSSSTAIHYKTGWIKNARCTTENYDCFFYLIWGKMVSLNRKPRTLPNDIETLFVESKFGSTW